MVKKYKIVGLDCPNCAKTLEQEISKQNNIKRAEINFVKEYLLLESDNLEIAIQEAKKVINALEPDAKILDRPHKNNYLNKHSICSTILLSLGLFLAVFTLFVYMPKWLYWMLYILSAVLIGYKTFFKAFKLLLKGIVNENLLVTISVIGAVAVGEHFEGLMVISLYSIGKLLESISLNKSKKSIENLTNLTPEYVNVIKDGNKLVLNPKDVHTNDIILVKTGEKVPLDGIVVEGDATINLQSLTGESLPIYVKANEDILSGSIVVNGVLTIRVTKEYENSTVSKILNLIENAQEKKSKTETIISKISKWYTYAVMALSVIVFGIVWIITKNLNDAIYRGLIFLVISCPCAFAISVPLTYFSGIGNASKNGILIKGTNYLDALNKVKEVCFDKTGTLTTGEFNITKIEILNNQYTKEEIIFLASLGEQYSLHPLAKAIVNCCDKPLASVKNIKEIAGEGVYYSYNKNKYFVGKKDYTLKSTVVEVYKNDLKIANIFLSDKVKDSAVNAIYNLKKISVKTVLLSGDKAEAVETLANELGIDKYYSNLLPKDKYEYIEKHKNQDRLIAYVGDGINDAPALTIADVGISMGINGSSASIEASDIVLVDDNPNKVYKAIRISKFTKKIVWENIAISGIIKVLFLSLGAFGVTGMLSAVIADVGVTLLAIFNSLRALKGQKNKFECKN